jgi:pilus assembly protein Flp/PilA
MTAPGNGSSCLDAQLIRVSPRTQSGGCDSFEVVHSFTEKTMLSIFRRLMSNRDGATAIEYTLIASLIAVAAIAAMGSVGTKVNGVLSNVASTMK